jgi:hypothetical protein
MNLLVLRTMILHLLTVLLITTSNLNNNNMEAAMNVSRVVLRPHSLTSLENQSFQGGRLIISLKLREDCSNSSNDSFILAAKVKEKL